MKKTNGMGNKKTDEFKTFVEGDMFRVCTVSKVTGFNEKSHELIIRGEDPKKELAVEQKLKDGNYIVIGICSYSQKDEEAVYEDVGNRTIAALRSIIETADNDSDRVALVEELTNSAEFALNALRDMNE